MHIGIDGVYDYINSCKQMGEPGAQEDSQASRESSQDRPVEKQVIALARTPTKGIIMSKHGGSELTVTSKRN